MCGGDIDDSEWLVNWKECGRNPSPGICVKHDVRSAVDVRACIQGRGASHWIACLQ